MHTAATCSCLNPDIACNRDPESTRQGYDRTRRSDSGCMDTAWWHAAYSAEKSEHLVELFAIGCTHPAESETAVR